MVVFDRDLVANPQIPAPAGDAYLWSIVALLSAAAVFAGYLVVLLAGAAFSVSARRQQRALAVAASVGASRSDIFRVVALQGTVLGVVGGVVGAALGVSLGILALHLLDDGAVSSFWGVHIPGGSSSPSSSSRRSWGRSPRSPPPEQRPAVRSSPRSGERGGRSRCG